MSEKKEYLPKDWGSDDQMSGYMSALKIRSVNPTNYDRVMDFWRKRIEDYCLCEKKCVIGYDELKFKFKRGNQLPAPMVTVLEELYNSQLIVPVGELASPRAGWLQWGASVLASKSSWLTGAKVDFQKTNFIHMPTLRAQAKELLNFYKNEYEMADCPEVVEYSEFKNRCAGLCDSASFDYALDELIRQGEVSERMLDTGDRILKFKDQTSKGPAKFTEADASVHELRKTMTKVDAELRRIEQRVKKFDQELRDNLHKNKPAALQALKKKKRAEKEMTDKDKQYQQLVKMFENLANSKQSREIIDAYKSATHAYKNALTRQGLTLEQVDDTMDSLHEVMQEANDIDEALTQGFANMPAAVGHTDEASLEAELASLMAEDGVREKKRESVLPDLPSVPSGDLFDTSDVATRLKRLREPTH